MGALFCWMKKKQKEKGQKGKTNVTNKEIAETLKANFTGLGC